MQGTDIAEPLPSMGQVLSTCEDSMKVSSLLLCEISAII